MAWDGEEFGKNIVLAVNDSIERSITPILRRLDALEAIGLPRDGKDADPVDMDAVKAMIDDAVSKAVGSAPLPKDGRDGKDADPVDMDAVKAIIVEECKDIRAGLESVIGPEMQEALSVQVAEAVSAAVKAIPAPKDGRDGKDADPVDMDAVKAIIVEQMTSVADEVRSTIVIPELPDIAGIVDEAVKAIELPPLPELPDIAAMVDEAVKAIPAPKDGRDGKDADPVDMDAIHKRLDAAIDAGIKAYHQIVREIPLPKDGKDGQSVSIDDVKPLVDDAVSKAVASIPAPKDGRDGVDGVDAMIDRNGDLVFTMSNGTMKNVGRVVGYDGVDCDIDRVWEILNEKLAALPKPRDGVDGMGFDDLTMEYDGERTFKFVLTRGEQRKEFAFAVPVVLDRGVYVEGKSYAQGDSVTWAGSTWIAQVADATDKPGGTSKQWRLAVKRGSPGKDGTLLIPRENKPVQLGV